MSANLQYIYAEIDLETGMCIGVMTTTIDREGNPEYVEIPTLTEDYLFKFYIDGAWYEDAEGTIPWSPEE
jgi:hypothetical protein